MLDLVYDLADRLESEKIEFFQAVRDEFLKLSQAEPDRFLVVDASQTPEQIFVHIAKKLDEKVGKRASSGFLSYSLHHSR